MNRNRPTGAGARQKFFTEVAAGDLPSSAEGPAEQAGQDLLAEDADLTMKEAEEFLDNLLGEKQQE